MGEMPPLALIHGSLLFRFAFDGLLRRRDEHGLTLPVAADVTLLAIPPLGWK